MSATIWISGWTTRRAARFADLVDDPVVPAAGGRVDAHLEDLLVTVGALRSVADAAPPARPEVVADLRGRLLLEAETALRPAEDRLLLTRQTARRRPARLVAASAALVIAGGTAGVAVAAEHSLPGESLYTLKQGLESTGQALQIGRADRGRYQLGQAGTRLDEVTELVRRGDDNEVSGTLSRFTASSGHGADALFTAYQADNDPADVTAVRTFAAEAMTRLNALSTTFPSADQAQLRRAASFLATLDQEAQLLCSQCGPASALAMPSSLGAPVGVDLPPAAEAAAAEAGQATAGAQPSQVALTGAAGTPAATSPTAPVASALSTSAAGGVVKQATPGSGVVKQALPSAVDTVASEAASALNGVLDAASGVVSGTVNGATSSVGGLLVSTPKP